MCRIEWAYDWYEDTISWLKKAENTLIPGTIPINDGSTDNAHCVLGRIRLKLMRSSKMVPNTFGSKYAFPVTRDTDTGWLCHEYLQRRWYKVVATDRERIFWAKGIWNGLEGAQSTTSLVESIAFSDVWNINHILDGSCFGSRRHRSRARSSLELYLTYSLVYSFQFIS